MTADDRTLGLEGVIAAHVLHPGESVCACGNWRILSLIDPPHITHAAHVAERVRAHLAPLGALADEWAEDGASLVRNAYSGGDVHEGETTERCARQLRAVLAATLGEGK